MSWWKTAQVGDRVTCIEGNFPKESYGDCDLIKGAIYEIESIRPDTEFIHTTRTGIVIFLVGTEFGYCASTLRPVQKTSTQTGNSSQGRNNMAGDS